MEFNELYEISLLRENTQYSISDKDGNIYIGEILTFFELDEDAFEDEMKENSKSYQNVCFKIIKIIKLSTENSLKNNTDSIVYSEYDFPIDIKEIC